MYYLAEFILGEAVGLISKILTYARVFPQVKNILPKLAFTHRTKINLTKATT